MKIETFVTKNVLKDGTIKGEKGSVEHRGRIIISQENGGCSLQGCNCSPGFWLSITKPRTKGGTVETVKVLFDNKKEMEHFLKYREVICEQKNSK